MGAWGTAIFSDDFACDVRDDYIKEIIKGKTSEEATAIIKEEHFPTKPDDEDIPVFWISLAVTQWKKGRLLPEVKAEAISVIESGYDLIRWESEPKKTQEKRKDALEKAKRILLSPMPPAKKIPVPSWMKDDPWQLGDLISYKITREDIAYPEYLEKYVILRIAEARPIQGDDPKSNFYAVYNWCSEKIPDKIEIKDKEYLKLREVVDSKGEKRYESCKYISIEKRDIKEHDMKVLANDAEFNIEKDEFFINGVCSSMLSNPFPFDNQLSKLLHAEALKAKGETGDGSACPR